MTEHDIFVDRFSVQAGSCGDITISSGGIRSKPVYQRQVGRTFGNVPLTQQLESFDADARGASDEWVLEFSGDPAVVVVMLLVPECFDLDLYATTDGSTPRIGYGDLRSFRGLDNDDAIFTDISVSTMGLLVHYFGTARETAADKNAYPRNPNVNTLNYALAVAAPDANGNDTVSDLRLR